MLRIAFISVCVVAIVSAALMRYYIPALIIGIASGIVFFVIGFLSGQGLSAQEKFGQRPGDVTTRIGISLVAAGIAAAALDPARHFPDSFRVFYGVCLAVACIGALSLAARKEAKAKK